MTEEKTYDYYEQRSKERRRKWEETRRKQEQKRKMLLFGGPACIVCLVVLIFVLRGCSSAAEEPASSTEPVTPTQYGPVQNEGMVSFEGEELSLPPVVEEVPEAAVSHSGNKEYVFDMSGASFLGTDQVMSSYALLVNADSMMGLRQKDSEVRINPASMTKILTVLVAAEHISNLEDTFEITREVTDFSYVNDCSNVGFEIGEVVTIKDLMYGTILPSGGDAAYALSVYVAGSHEAFVDMMNEKLASLGISDTAHFTNCVGLYAEDHYCTLKDMAVILAAAMDNEIAREVLSAHVYTTSQTKEHTEGLVISNWFLRRIEDCDCGGKVIGAKTGYVVQSGNCAASYFEAEDGSHYICVTAKAGSSWQAIYDHVAIYNIYVAGNTAYVRGTK